MRIGKLDIGPGQPLLLIAGPCVIESEQLCCDVAGTLQQICAELGLSYIFKASFDKANRTSAGSRRGPGMDEGLAILQRVATEFDLPVTTDVHESPQCQPVANVCRLLQIPAFLCRQTDLLVAAGQAAAATEGAVNVKKGQFLAPADMRHAVAKVQVGGCTRVMLTERGTTFGYGNLVVDFRGLEIMRQFGPVCFDATHSVQQPGAGGDRSGGDRERVPGLVRAAMAVGVDALFLETHPDPDSAWSDGPNMIPLARMKSLLEQALQVRAWTGVPSPGSVSPNID